MGTSETFICSGADHHLHSKMNITTVSEDCNSNDHLYFKYFQVAVLTNSNNFVDIVIRVVC